MRLLQSQGAAAAGVAGGGLTSASAYAPKEYNKVDLAVFQRMYHGKSTKMTVCDPAPAAVPAALCIDCYDTQYIAAGERPLPSSHVRCDAVPQMRRTRCRRSRRRRSPT